MRLILITLFFALAFLPAPFCFATDTAAVAAALKDEAAECRYLQKLCEDTQSSWKNYWQVAELSKQKTAAFERAVHAPSYNREVAQDAREASEQASVTASAAGLLFDASSRELADATRVIAAKHPQMPKCYEKCPITE